MDKNSQAVIPDNIIVVEGDGLNPVPTPEAGDAGKVLGVLNSSGDIGWVEDQGGTLTQVQSDWAETDNTKVSYIDHKPDLSVYATTSAVNTALADKQDVISDLSDIRSGAALGATAVQPSDMPSSDELVPSATSGDAGKVLTVDSQGDPSWVTPSSSNVTTADKQFTVGVNGTGLPITVDCSNATSGSEVQSFSENGTYRFTSYPGIVFPLAHLSVCDLSAGTTTGNATLTIPEDISFDSAMPVNVLASYWNGERSGPMCSITGTIVGTGKINAGTYTISGSNVDPTGYNQGVFLFFTGGTGYEESWNNFKSAIETAAASFTLGYSASVVTGYSINPAVLPSLTNNAGKVLAVNSAANGVQWDALPEYTAGNGLMKNANEFSVVNGSGISFGNATVQKTIALQGVPNGSGYNTGYISIIGLLNEDIVNAIEAGPISVVLTFNGWANAYGTYKLSIVEWDAVGSIPNTQKRISYNVSTSTAAGTYSYDLSNTTASGSLQFATVKANPSGYALAFVGSYDSPVNSTDTYSAPVNTGSTTVSVVVHNAVAVTNPLPASAQADSGKVLKVNASGNAEWGSDGFTTTAGITDIQVVNALPASPVATVLYLLPEA